ncbi:TetR/AcrR family transcriptional regulator [Streptomyces sp. NPDC001941]|uniref:TetR/AcrR family transcriptional regulator n=1 Tax=Streptomyces sp. NPDC001941 TaxID=3154659 RepID=UPI003323A5FE
MSSPSSGPEQPGRPTRSDARRNRERLLEAARAAFATGDGAVALEAVARKAGVGIATLYRHFPTREALVEAAYAAELDDVTRAAHTLLAEREPAAALRAWTDHYASFVTAKHAMMSALRAGGASGGISTPATRARLTAAIAAILEAGAATGSLRADVDPGDVTAMLLGVFLSTAAIGAPERVDALLDLLVDALRPPSAG